MAIAALAALLLAVSGGFGSGKIPLLPRLGYWLLILVSATLWGIGVLVGLRAWGRLAPRSLSEGLLVAAASTVPVTLLVLGMNAAFFGSAPSPRSAALTSSLVLLVSGLVVAVNFLAGRPLEAPHDVAAAAAAPAGSHSPPEPPPLLSRLPPHLRHANIEALQAEDHYLRVHTDAGEALILMRLSDAIGEVSGLQGMQTHRSWWVARSAIAAVERSEGRATLTLRSGAQAPVSRSFYKGFRQRGWFS